MLHTADTVGLIDPTQHLCTVANLIMQEICTLVIIVNIIKQQAYVIIVHYIKLKFKVYHSKFWK